LLITFATKFYLRSETFISYNVVQGTPKEGAFLFGRKNVMHVLDPFFFI